MNRPSRRNVPPLCRSCTTTAKLVALITSVALLTSCTSPQYRAAKKPVPPVLINLPCTEPPIEALLHTVIIYRGPGSWKQDAYWDEYVVTVANRGDVTITVDAATLTDFQGETVLTDEDPWLLETTSRELTDKGGVFAMNAAVQIGGGATVVAVGGGVGALVLAGGWVTAAGGAAMGGILLLPAYIGGSIYTNINNRHAIEEEFERRCFPLPSPLAPGQLAQGSFFFRISPGPKRLTLKCRIDEEPRSVVIDLAPIAGLHLKSPTKASAPATTPTARSPH